MCEEKALELTGHTARGHASCAEVSVAQFADPANIRSVKLDPEYGPLDHTFYNAEDFRRRFPDGASNPTPRKPAPKSARLGGNHG